MIALDDIRNKLCGRVTTLDRAFDRQVLLPSVKRRVDRYARQEGIVSVLWQVWCTFCRSTLIASALGARRRSGQQTSSPYLGRSEMEVAAIAKHCSRGGKPRHGLPRLQGMYQEPVWGDLNKINLIVFGLSSSNSENLASAFGIGIALRDLQLCRNANAHINADTIASVKQARVRYSDTKFTHPSDVMYWVDPATRDFVWKTWIQEMLVISEFTAQ